VRIVIPTVLTLEDELNAIRSVLCPTPCPPSRPAGVGADAEADAAAAADVVNDAPPKPHFLDHRGLQFSTISTTAMWYKIEEHLRYGIPLLSTPPHDQAFPLGAAAVSPSASPIPGRKVTEVGELNLVNCAFVTPPALQFYPRVESLVDIRTYIGRLALQTER
jgi:hypothetical protein